MLEGDSGTTEMVFTVTLSEAASSDLTADYATSDGTATAGEDYTEVSGQISIAAGGTTASVIVLVSGDTKPEQDESFNLDITNPQGITLTETSFTTFSTIENDDNADAGYFTGTATLGGTLYEDITAMMYSNRVLMFSPSANVLYDIAVTGSGSFTAAVDVYEDGLNAQTVSIADGVIDGLQITGTLAGGTGFGAGSFDILFDVDNNEGATLGRIEETTNWWEGDFYGIDSGDGKFSSNATGGYFGGDVIDEFCVFRKDVSTLGQLVIPDISANIYELEHSITPSVIGTCSPPYESTGHTGFAAVVSEGSGTDNKLFFAFNNDNIALFGILSRP
ncbi:MAG: hypothetical protein GY779_12190 [Gammaproteobacteria bacterium]|nr:hypothetical protein [Gammaproteobacteria bacterium]